MEKSDKRIRDVDPISLPVNTEINTKADLAKIVEEPCLAACEDLYDKNIITNYSNSNKNHSDEAFIAIRDDATLSDENKAIIDRLLSEGKIERYDYGGQNVKFGIKTSPDMLVSDVSKQLKQFVSVLKHQDIRYNMLTPEDILDNINALIDKYPEHQDKILAEYKQEDGSYAIDPEIYAKGRGYLYDAESGNSYKDAETLRRHKAYTEIKNSPKPNIVARGKGRS